MTYEYSEKELKELFQEQIDFLKSSSVAYDNGFLGEIKRLAVTVRVLLHDTKTSTSLTSHLGIKNRLYLDTSFPFDERNQGSHSSLVKFAGTVKGMKVIPFLYEGLGQRQESFDDWWNGIVFVDKERNKFSRKDIVLSLANKEGGAHVDKALDEAYANLRKNNSLGWYKVDPTGKETPGEDQVPPTMRQIAHEVLKTFVPGYECKRDGEPRETIFIPGGIFKGESAPAIPTKNPTKQPTQKRKRKKIGRNELCPCGSGKKFKRCCLTSKP